MEELNNLPFDLSFDISSLIAGLIFGVIGYWLYKQGRKNSNIPIVCSGVGLMVYPYFVNGALWNWLIGFVLCGFAYLNWEN
jgi:nicotinamide riboside transporter PnuC